MFFTFFRLHEKHPWYSEQLAFLLMNTDNNAYLTKEELMEASKVSDDISALNFSNKQLENLIGMMIVISFTKFLLESLMDIAPNYVPS